MIRFLLLIYLPLLPLTKRPLSKEAQELILKSCFHLTALSHTDNQIKVRPQNTSFLPFAKELDQMARYATEVRFYPEVFRGPFTGHLGDNLLFGATIHTEGQPVGRSSFLVVAVTKGPSITGPYGWFLQIGHQLRILDMRPVPLNCRGVYGLDLTFSGLDPALGRVIHRAVISWGQAAIWPAFSTGGFALGPSGTFSYGPSFELTAPWLVRRSGIEKRNCIVVFSSVQLRSHHMPSLTTTALDLKENTVIEAPPASRPRLLYHLVTALTLLRAGVLLNPHNLILERLLWLWEGINLWAFGYSKDLATFVNLLLAIS